MTETEKKIKELEWLMHLIEEDNPKEKYEIIRIGFAFNAYSFGYPIHLIAYVANISEGTAYTWFRRNPLEYEKIKIKRNKRLKKQKNSNDKSNLDHYKENKPHGT